MWRVGCCLLWTSSLWVATRWEQKKSRPRTRAALNLSRYYCSWTWVTVWSIAPWIHLTATIQVSTEDGHRYTNRKLTAAGQLITYATLASGSLGVTFTRGHTQKGVNLTFKQRHASYCSVWEWRVYLVVLQLERFSEANLIALPLISHMVWW